MDKNYMKKFGERVRARREELGMSQLDLALKVNLQTKQAISKIENGERGVDVDRAEMLAAAPPISPSGIRTGTCEIRKASSRVRTAQAAPMEAAFTPWENL